MTQKQFHNKAWLKTWWVRESLKLHLAPIEVDKNVSNLSKLQPSSLSFEKILLEAVDKGFSMFGDLSNEVSARANVFIIAESQYWHCKQHSQN